MIFVKPCLTFGFLSDMLGLCLVRDSQGFVEHVATFVYSVATLVKYAGALSRIVMCPHSFPPLCLTPPLPRGPWADINI